MKNVESVTVQERIRMKNRLGDKPTLVSFFDKNYSTNCAVGNHKGCSNNRETCECGHHSNNPFPKFIPQARIARNKRTKQNYDKLTIQQRNARNTKVRLMKQSGKWK